MAVVRARQAWPCLCVCDADKERDEVDKVKNTGAVLVAAGMSSRMEDFKPMLPFGNSTIILHIVSELKNLNLDPILVVTGYRAEELEEHLSHAGVRFLRNERYEKTQMFDSVCMGIEAVWQECERIVVMPADTPAIMEETFRQVLKIDADMVRTMYGGRPGHPIVLRSSIARELCDYTGDGGLRGAMEHFGHAITSLEVEDWGVNWDVDTREEYQALLERNFSRGQGYPVHPQVQVRLAASEVFFGPGVARLLELIDRTGSIQEACARMELSYSKGSRMIRQVERQLGVLVVQRWTGGAGGGGSSLTAEGRCLTENYAELVRQVQKRTQELYGQYFGQGLKG